MGGLLDRLKTLFTGGSIEVVFIGLENSGKTTLLNQMSMGEAQPTAPTIGLNVKNFKKGGCAMKVWDIGGQVQYRQEWGMYTKGCDCVIFLIDASNRAALSTAKKELHLLLEDRDINGIPLLVVGNKVDLPGHMTEKEIIEGMNLDYITTNAWAVVMISALQGTNVTGVVDWLIKQSKA